MSHVTVDGDDAGDVQPEQGTDGSGDGAGIIAADLLCAAALTPAAAKAYLGGITRVRDGGLQGLDALCGAIGDHLAAQDKLRREGRPERGTGEPGEPAQQTIDDAKNGSGASYVS